MGFGKYKVYKRNKVEIYNHVYYSRLTRHERFFTFLFVFFFVVVGLAGVLTMTKTSARIDRFTLILKSYSIEHEAEHQTKPSTWHFVEESYAGPKYGGPK